MKSLNSEKKKKGNEGNFALISFHLLAFICRQLALGLYPGPQETNVVSSPAGGLSQISLMPFREACPLRPTMMWSCTATPNDLAIAMMSKVILMSWVDGVGSPEGWL